VPNILKLNTMKKETLIIAIIIALVIISIPLSFWAGNIAPTFFTIWCTLSVGVTFFGNTDTFKS